MGHIAMQIGLVSKDTSPSLLSRGIRPHPDEKSQYLKLSWRRDLNPRPSDYKSDALPLSYASTQTEQNYHTGNQIASNFMRQAILSPRGL